MNGGAEQGVGMSAQFKAAIGRALLGAVIAFGITYATTILSVEDDCGASSPRARRNCEAGTDSKQQKAFWPSLAAALAYIGARAGLEGAYDTRRQQTGDHHAADVTPKPDGPSPRASGGNGGAGP